MAKKIKLSKMTEQGRKNLLAHQKANRAKMTPSQVAVETQNVADTVVSNGSPAPRVLNAGEKRGHYQCDDGTTVLRAKRGGESGYVVNDTLTGEETFIVGGISDVREQMNFTS